MLRIISFYLFLCGSISFAQIGVDPPEISATGDQYYCPGDKLPVVTDFDLSTEEGAITEFFIQVSSGYQFGSDFLELTGSHDNITWSFNQNTAKLTLSSIDNNPLDLEVIIEAVKSVVFYSTNENIQGERFFSFTLGDANFLPSTGHYYEYVPDIGITWTLARAAAEARTYYGIPGYLATITSAEEAQLSGEQADGAGWIGGSDEELEGTWKWVTGPEAGTVFWIGDMNGSAPNGEFAFWNNGEPNNLGDEDYAHITAPNVGITGSWNDLSVTGEPSGDYQPKGYIVEYGYNDPDDAPIFSAFTRAYTNVIDSVFSGSNCGPGKVELRATVIEYEDQTDKTEVYWFDSEEGENPVFIGDTFEVDLSESKDFYVLASQNGCAKGARKVVSARIFEIPEINKEVTLKNCDQDEDPTDGFTDFNLEEANELIPLDNAEDQPLTFSYYLTEDEANQGINALDPFPFNSRTSSLVFGRAESEEGCFDIASVFLEVSATQPVEIVNLESCDTDDVNDGLVRFDLTEATNQILIQLPPQDLRVQYYRTLDDATLEQNEIIPQDDYVNEDPYFQTLFVRVESVNNGECISLGEFVELYVFPLPEFDLLSETVYCQNVGPFEISISNPDGDYSYEWRNDSDELISNEGVALIQSPGVYKVVGMSAEGCVSKERTLVVEESSIASITQDDIEVIDGGENNSIRIDPSNLGIGDYEYALDNQFGPYQDEPFFDGVLPGIHTVFVRDKNGCGIASIEVSVIGYPKFFTPNGDGYNDTWQVLGVSFQPMSDIYIFNKFGKLLAELDASGEGWDGIFNGKQLPSADYWYRVQLEDGRIHTGHFSLIRR
ncbi:T9SS type B sorting domain-containing protein [Lutimonas zeaxanthinifaciens]|uniref:T9SS type B sorting domain-containing protein n=1 Tax=Lutimonas zeaxanthinifaciens TaxID=3060215 RepID=UPI00265C98F8|nr:T9SS type B sorting domain-containing protein [Lutimonas sp. YSD2104]WKK64608.1 T9SS type B sorting domain-containing protein [Lutimonas sp. YSD2104]